MPELILMRHAQALPAALDGEDFSRPLSAVGRAAAAAAARRLQLEGVGIERVLSSPARRASETAAIVMRELGLGAALLQQVPELYLATPAAIREVIQRCHANAGTLLVVGHNPSLSEFGGTLSGDFAESHLPTAGIWRVPFTAAGWRGLTRTEPTP